MFQRGHESEASVIETVPHLEEAPQVRGDTITMTRLRNGS
jgi:hypothetical protein